MSSEDEDMLEEDEVITATEETVDSSGHEPSVIREEINQQPPQKDADEELDPVMLKYMKLVREKKSLATEQASKVGLPLVLVNVGVLLLFFFFFFFFFGGGGGVVFFFF